MVVLEVAGLDDGADLEGRAAQGRAGELEVGESAVRSPQVAEAVAVDVPAANSFPQRIELAHGERLREGVVDAAEEGRARVARRDVSGRAEGRGTSSHAGASPSRVIHARSRRARPP